ncbi:MAG: sigma-54 dependent transcriptional regulator, partial [Planctomycetota bacterium]|nr:sigma-54 dependent transcriptional regulator [Planctomycetota bacterium]
MASATVLVVDDEIPACKSCQDILSAEGYIVEFVFSAEDALKVLEEKTYDLIITDLKMDKIDGIELIERIKKKKESDIPVIVMTGYATIETAVEAMRKGAYDYITKPFTPATLRVAVSKALEKSNLLKQIHYLRESQRSKYELEHVIGSSTAIQVVYALVDKVAPSDTTVLLLGESGTGKEVIARAIHYKSSRACKQFVPVDCATLARTLLESELFGHERGAFPGAQYRRKGKFEMADGGT